MATMMNGTMDTARHVMGSARETAEQAVGNAKHALGSAKEGAEHTLSSTMSYLTTGAKAVAGFASVLRALGVDDALGWVGLRRRQSPFYPIAIFGAGVAVGAGVGMLLAPKSGAQIRRSILKAFNDITGEAKDALQRVESEVKEAGEKVEEKAEELADKAKGAALKAERKIESKIENKMENNKVETAASAPRAGNGHR